MNKADRNHASFQRQLAEHHVAVGVVAAWFSRHGYTAIIPPLQVAPTVQERERFSDQGDLYLNGREIVGASRRVEVKHLQYQWTGPEDWPHRDYMVASKASIDRADPFPWMWCALNPPMTHMGIILGSTRKHWRTRKFRPRNFEDIENVSYCAPLDLVQWRRL